MGITRSTGSLPSGSFIGSVMVPNITPNRLQGLRQSERVIAAGDVAEIRMNTGVCGIFHAVYVRQRTELFEKLPDHLHFPLFE
jgi:hypothetical protein